MAFNSLSLPIRQIKNSLHKEQKQKQHTRIYYDLVLDLLLLSLSLSLFLSLSLSLDFYLTAVDRKCISIYGRVANHGKGRVCYSSAQVAAT